MPIDPRKEALFGLSDAHARAHLVAQKHTAAEAQAQAGMAGIAGDAQQYPWCLQSQLAMLFEWCETIERSIVHLEVQCECFALPEKPSSDLDGKNQPAPEMSPLTATVVNLGDRLRRINARLETLSGRLDVCR